MPAAVAVLRHVRVEMRSADDFTVWDAGEPGETEADAVGPVVSTESVPCVGLLVGLLEGVGWATAVTAAEASAEPVPTLVGTAKTEAKSLSAAGKARPPPGQRSTGGDGCKSTSDETLPKSRKVVNPHTLPVCAKIARDRRR